jgi:two-component system cell cycle response regulator
MTATVLVVDDLEQNVKLLEAKLSNEYYSVITANGGQEALKILEEKDIDVILLDVMMPDMDGFETCEKIKNNIKTSHIPVLMVTALSEVEYRIKGLKTGADEFLTKPINDTALFARVKSLSRIKFMIDELRLRNQSEAELEENLTQVQNKESFEDNRVMIIDDDYVTAQNLSDMVAGVTQKVEVTEDPEDFFTKIEQEDIDLVIISCQIEGVDALRISAKIKSHDKGRNTPILLLAEEENFNQLVKGLEIGVNDYFMWPVDENELIARLKTQLRRKIYQEALRESLAQSVSLSLKDGLTNLHNRRYLDAHGNKMLARAAESETAFSFVMIDIDEFKPVNDTHGHQVGDEILKQIAEILKNAVRATDLVARYGGEEFAICLPRASMEEAIQIAERIRKAVADHSFQLPPEIGELNCTISLGVSEYDPSKDNLSDLISRSDEALYKAKEAGRNQVVRGE